MGRFSRGAPKSRGAGRLVNFSKSCPDMIILFNTSSGRKHQHKLFMDIKS